MVLSVATAVRVSKETPRLPNAHSFSFVCRPKDKKSLLEVPNVSTSRFSWQNSVILNIKINEL